jgi:hypothetical protein
MIFALLACAPAEPEPTADTATVEVPVPVAGRYTIELAEEWEGDCQLDDPATYDDLVQEWTFDPRGDVLVLYLDFWNLTSCTLDGLDFSCDDGSWSGGRAEVQKRIEGTLTPTGRVEGQRVLELDCGGPGCDTLQDSYGRRLDFPCRAEVPFEGAVE